MYKMKDGNAYNVPIPTYYAETQTEVDEIVQIVPAGTLIEFNGATEFKLLIVRADGTYNEV